MVVEYIRYTIEDDRNMAFIEAYRQASQALLRSPFCKAYEFCQCIEDKEQFIIRIEWTSAEDHLQKFRKSSEFKNFILYVREYINDITEMRHYYKLQ